jgi:hypothetical protein
MRLRMSEEKVRNMFVEGGALEGPAIRGRAQDSVGALVIFNSKYARTDCLRHYRTIRSSGFAGWCSTRDPALVLGGRRLQVEEAPEPTDILWENVEVGRGQLLLRALLANMASVLIIILSFGVVVTVKVQQHSLSGEIGFCAAPALAATCNAHLDWSAPAPLSSCAEQAQRSVTGGSTACSLGDVWGVTALNASAEREVALPVLAATPMTVDRGGGAGGAPPVNLLAAAACRFSPASGLLPRSALLAAEGGGGGVGAEGCLAKVTPTREQLSALLRAPYSQNFTVEVPDSGAAASTAAASAVGGTGTSGAEFCRRCLCRSVMETQPSTWHASLSSAVAPDGSGPCDHQLAQETLGWVLEALVVVVVVACNALLRTVVTWLSAFKRVKLVSQLEATIARSVFVGQFANTALVTLIVYARVQGASDTFARGVGDVVATLHGLDAAQRAALLRQILNLLPFSGRYTDLSAQWYSTVGIAMLITFASNIMLPLLPLLGGITNRLVLSCRSCWRGSYTRRSLARKLEAPGFELGARYGMMLNLIFTSLLLTPGMPVLWLVAAALFALTYAVDKVVLLRFSRTPVNYSQRIAKSCTRYCVFAVLLHMTMSIWTFSSSSQPSSGPSYDI